MRLRALAFCLAAALGASSVACVAPAEDGSPDGDDVAGSDADLSEAAQRAARFQKVDGVELTPSQRQELLARYAGIEHDGVRATLWEKALQFYDANLDQITNKRWLSVVDFAKPSGEHRFFVMDMNGGSSRSFVVAHGSGSDPNNDGIATQFSNTPGSNMSSVGFYETGEQYTGVHGLSLRLDGLSETNSNARKRSIVIHEASYVVDGAAKQGRSHGCLAVSNDDRPWILANLKNAIIYASD